MNQRVRRGGPAPYRSRDRSLSTARRTSPVPGAGAPAAHEAEPPSSLPLSGSAAGSVFVARRIGGPRRGEPIAAAFLAEDALEVVRARLAVEPAPAEAFVVSEEPASTLDEIRAEIRAVARRELWARRLDGCSVGMVLASLIWWVAS